MRLPVRLTPQHPLRKIIAAILIAAGATALGTGAHYVPGLKAAMAGLHNTLYDAFYKFRKPEDRTASPIVIVAVDETTVQTMAKRNYRWPFPRIVWASAVPYLEQCGARAIVFDITFQDQGAFDAEFGKALDAAKIPVVIGSLFNSDGTPQPFAPRVTKPPTLGAVNLIGGKDETTVREYRPYTYGAPSLALRAATAMRAELPAWGQEPFRLRYYGPYVWKDGRTTYRYIPALRVFQDSMDSKHTKLAEDTAMFHDKLVVFGTTALGTYDVKSSPLSSLFPGVEAQVTAIDNLMSGQRVIPISAALCGIITFLASLLATFGVVLPKRVSFKVIAAFVAVAAVTTFAVAIFIRSAIYWLPMASPLAALLIAVVGAFAFSYFTEDRQRRLVLKALTQYLSPEVAAEIERNPDSLKLGGQRREMTVLFSDIAGFTDLSETMESEKLSEMLNFYLGEMSAMILQCNGTLDKYIGDAIMSFWNAPVQQPDHAVLACRAALAMRDREAQIQEQLKSLGAPGLMTRIGVNSGPMVFGNMGSPQKFNYSVLGDSVNLGSRLEGANKLYGSRILIAETTAALVNGQFVLRELDRLRVKGKQKPLAVFELIAEGSADPSTKERIAQYEQALALYRAQKWDEAQASLDNLHGKFPDDGPVSALLKRIAKLRHGPPPADWDGVYVAKDK